jgi:hypothetical protein
MFLEDGGAGNLIIGADLVHADAIDGSVDTQRPMYEDLSRLDEVDRDRTDGAGDHEALVNVVGRVNSGGAAQHGL